jgi:thiol:disulfide interchange protein DsbC
MKIRTKIAAMGLAAGIVISMSGVVWAFEKPPTKEEALEQLKNMLKNTPIMAFRPSPVPELFEVVTGDQIFFFSPKGGVLFFGEMYDKTGKNLTAERKEQLASDPKVIEYRKKKAAEQAQIKVEMQKQQVEMEKRLPEMMKNLPLEKATKIGIGPIKVIELTDPDCPFCRKAEREALAGRTDITRYVFFYPLRQMHPNAANKAAYIASQSDADIEKVFADVFSGKFDSQNIPASTHEGQKHVSEQEEIVKSLGVNGVPAFYINNTLVSGADSDKINQLLNQAGAKEVQASK